MTMESFAPLISWLKNAKCVVLMILIIFTFGLKVDIVESPVVDVAEKSSQVPVIGMGRFSAGCLQEINIDSATSHLNESFM